MDRRKKTKDRPVWSFFTGAGGLDIGLEAAGFAPTLAVEVDKDCRATYRQNRPGVLLVDEPAVNPGDIALLTGARLRAISGEHRDIFMMIGGPPCQSFSTGGKRAALSDPRGNLIYHYLRLINEVRPELFVFENVANLLTAAVRHRPIAERPGQHWSLKRYAEENPVSDDGNAPLEADELSGSAIRRLIKDINRLGYDISLAVLNSADFGCAQKRLRLFIVGSRDGLAPSLPGPTFFDPLTGRKPQYVTLRDVIWDLQHDPGPHSVYTEEMERFFRLVPQGGNWRDLPEQLQREGLGKSYMAGGGKTGFFRRLSWDKPAPTIIGRANRKGSAICHPSQDRPLSVKECATIQGFPSSWEFSGSMSSQYMQVGNAVPTHLSTAVGMAIRDRIDAPTELHRRLSLECQIDVAVKQLWAAARNLKSQLKASKQNSASLFGDED
ncbi:MAG: DNA cytosine methyltransferase [Planctomycetaceae bacterium]